MGKDATMGETLLGKLMGSFSKVELAELERYAAYKLDSPEMLLGIALLVEKEVHLISFEEFWGHCFPGADLESEVGKFRKMVHRIREFVLEFLAVRYAIRNKASTLENAFRFMAFSEWDEHLRLLAGRLQKSISNMPDDWAAYSLRIELEEAELASRIRKQNEITGEELEVGWRNIEERFLLDKLRYDCLRLDLQLQEGTPLSLPYRTAWLEGISFETGSLPHAYHELRAMLSQPNSEDHFDAARKTIFEADDKRELGKTERLELLQLLLNQAIRRARNGRSDYAVAKQTLMRILPEGKRKIHQRTLKNAIALFVLAGDVKLARKTFEKFQGRIKGDAADHARMYNEAVVLYYEKRFGKARAMFYDVIYATEDHYMKADGRIYWWRSLIDEVLAGGAYDEDFLRYQGQNTKKFFARSTDMTQKTRAFCLRFFQLIYQLYKALGLNGEKKRQLLHGLEQKMEQLQGHPLKTWLGEKLKEVNE